MFHECTQGQRSREDDASGGSDASFRTEGENVACLRTVNDDLNVILDVIEK